MENQAQAQNAQVQMTVQITRKETGKIDEYVLTGVAEMPEEKLFRIKADATFYAYDIDDAFNKLAYHFEHLSEDDEETVSDESVQEFFSTGGVEIKVEKEQ
jgi:hypothetical protein